MYVQLSTSLNSIWLCSEGLIDISFNVSCSRRGPLLRYMKSFWWLIRYDMMVSYRFVIVVDRDVKYIGCPAILSAGSNMRFIWWCASYGFRPVFHLYVNLKREREARTWKIKQKIFYCMYSTSAWARRELETRIYDMWPWNASVKPIATCSDFSRSRTAFTGEEQK